MFITTPDYPFCSIPSVILDENYFFLIRKSKKSSRINSGTVLKIHLLDLPNRLPSYRPLPWTNHKNAGWIYYLPNSTITAPRVGLRKQHKNLKHSSFILPMMRARDIVPSCQALSNLVGGITRSATPHNSFHSL